MKSTRMNHKRIAWRWLAIALLSATHLGLPTPGLARDLDAQVRVKVAPAQAWVADPVTLEYEVIAPRNVDIRFPAARTLDDDLHVVATESLDDLPLEGDRRQWIHRYTVEGLDPGQYSLPPLEISYLDHRQQPPATGKLKSPTATVVIRSALEEGETDPADFRDIKSAIWAPQPERSSFGFWAVAGAAGLVGLTFLGFLLVWRRPHRSSNLDWALQALRHLRKSPSFDQLTGEQVYVRVTNILRLFVEREFEIGASRLTTPEFLDQVQTDSRLSPALQRKLAQYLQLADQVKFAAATPNQASLSQVLDQTERLIRDAAEEKYQQEQRSKRESA